MTVKLIIFDFDGTLADTLDVTVSILNNLSTEFGYKPASAADVKKFRHLDSRKIITSYGISMFKLPFLLKRFRAKLKPEIHNIKPIAGISDVLEMLVTKDKLLGIVTSNSEKNVREFLKTNQLIDLFSFVDSVNHLFGKYKVIQRILQREGFTRQEVIYIGDETRDIEAAKKIGLKVIAVAWGFNEHQVLAEHHPDFLISQPDELLEIIESL
ncbi:MAG: carotenoid oxygenase [Candidatus Parabeggiatoa sp. nov. 1]|nr:MAG: carotenoid oxygenase [Gammaproteobacteria bacterium]